MKKLLLTLSFAAISATGLWAQTCQSGSAKYNSLVEAINAVPADGKL